MLSRIAAVAVVVAASAFVAVPLAADPGKDESGHGRRGHEWKHEYRDGHCKIERKMSRNGDYKEEVKCDGRRMGYLGAPVVIHRAPVSIHIELPPLPVGPAYAEPFQDARGRYCREYRTSAVIDNRTQTIYGTACLLPDGTWVFND